ncbi:MAG: urate hydroxylase PuuD [Terriglobales bacterium]
MLVCSLAAMVGAPSISPPDDVNTNMLMFVRLIHFLAGITWIGLLYFFNLVNIPFMREADQATRGKVIPLLMPRALWWFRWASVVTVAAGLWYWMVIVATDRRNAMLPSSGNAIWSFFVLWTVAFVIYMGALMAPKDVLQKGPVIGVITVLLTAGAAYAFLAINSQGWESNRLLSIGIGGGLGWFMMFNVWGIVWRFQKKLIRWTEKNAADGTPMPPQAARMARLVFLASRINAWLTIPMLFFMGAASHYPMFGSM